MFRDTVESVWVERYRETASRLEKLQESVSQLRTKLYQVRLDGQVPDDVFLELEQANKGELQEAESKLASARMDEICIEEVLAFCERLLTDVPMLWKDCSIDQQQRLQQVLFPAGMTYEDWLWNHCNLLIFSMLEGNSEDKTHLVALMGIEPMFQP